jgi:polyhydroxybutyrate depolymerase
MMRATLASVVLLLVPACQGSGSPEPSADRRGTLRHGGLDREYWVRLPPGHSPDKPHPVAFVLHGGGGLAEGHDAHCAGGTLGRAADRLGVVLVYPQGLGKRWQDGRAFARQEAKDDGDEPPDDVGFIVTLLDELEKTLNIDRKAVFAAGISNGGMMCCRLAAERPDVFAAVAPVAATLPREISGKPPGRPVSVILFHGTEDPLVPFGGGGVKLLRIARKTRGEVLSAEGTLAFFSGAAGCREKGAPEALPDADPEDETRVTRTVHVKGVDGAAAALYAIEGGGHTWPGGSQYAKERMIGRVCRDLDASQVMLEFFLAHRRP